MINHVEALKSLAGQMQHLAAKVAESPDGYGLAYADILTETIMQYRRIFNEMENNA